ncbi:hypothetical protein GE09DRAFT_589193 [Coniochaeta sp. 2T2.1]|nr:hypothetical protein GE09DRAFT_589193 [Coniochaeta sp. 2T2.1]
MDDIPHDELGFQPYEFPHGRNDNMASLSMSDTLPADYAIFGPDDFRFWSCTSNQWLQATPALHANSIAHQPMHDNYVFSFPEFPCTVYEMASSSEDNLLDMAVTPTDTQAPPTPLTDPYYQESIAKESKPFDSLAPATQTTNQATSAGATRQPAVAVLVPICSSVDHHSTKDPFHFDATTIATHDPGATRRAVIAARLRTARHSKSRRSSVEDDAGAAGTDPTDMVLAVGTRARLKHKRVEKHYRNRLSTQFERLLAVLPSEEFDSGRGGGDNGNDEKSGEGSVQNITTARVTKAEVLIVAARLIGVCSCIRGGRNDGHRGEE